jgi:hypothetical protein
MSAPSLAVAIEASTKPRWLRHMIATPSPSPTPSRGERVRQGVGALVELLEGELTELVDQADLARRAEREGGEAASRADAEVAARSSATSPRRAGRSDEPCPAGEDPEDLGGVLHLCCS